MMVPLASKWRSTVLSGPWWFGLGLKYGPVGIKIDEACVDPSSDRSWSTCWSHLPQDGDANSVLVHDDDDDSECGPVDIYHRFRCLSPYWNRLEQDLFIQAQNAIVVTYTRPMQTSDTVEALSCHVGIGPFRVLSGRPSSIVQFVSS